MDQLTAKGIQIAPLVLHTGVSNIETHEPPYKEYYRVSSETTEMVKRLAHRGIASLRLERQPYADSNL